MRRSSSARSKGREVRARAAGSVRYVAEHRGGRRVSGGGPGDGLSLVPGGEPASGEDRAPLARKAFGLGGVRAQERALGDSRWAAESVSRGAGQPHGRGPGSGVDAQGGRRLLPDGGGTWRDDGQVPARRAAAALPGGGTREARASGAGRRRSGGRGTLALRNGGGRAGQPGRGGAAAGRGGERRGPLRVDQHENWDLRMGVKEALQQQRALTELVEGSELVVKTTVLEDDLDEWPGADQRRAQVMHSGTLWLAREGLALSRVSPDLEL